MYIRQFIHGNMKSYSIDRRYIRSIYRRIIATIDSRTRGTATNEGRMHASMGRTQACIVSAMARGPFPTAASLIRAEVGA